MECSHVEPLPDLYRADYDYRIDEFISHNDANVHFVTLFMYAGIFMLAVGVIANNMYSKPHLSFDAKYHAVQLIFLFGSVASYNLHIMAQLFYYITTATIAAITVHSIGFFYMRI